MPSYSKQAFAAALVAAATGDIGNNDISGIMKLSIFVDPVGTKGSSGALAVDNFTANNAVE